MIILGAFFKCSLNSSLEHGDGEGDFQRRRFPIRMRTLPFRGVPGVRCDSCARACHLRQSSQSDGGEEVDGEASVSGVVSGEEAFEERLQGPKRRRSRQEAESIQESHLVLGWIRR